MVLSPSSSSCSEDSSDSTSVDSWPSASASEPRRRQFTELKEQMYRAKLADLKSQLKQLNERTLPEYVKKYRRLESMYKERMRVNGVVRDLEVEMVEEDFIHEKKAAAREFEEHKVYLREQLIAELEEKQKLIEAERHSMELTGDSMELKTISTRKLRRRANDPSNSSGYGPGEKRRKPVQLSSLTYLLEDSDILDDLKIINKNKAFSLHKTSSARGDRDGGSAGLAAHYSAAAHSSANNGRGSSSPSNSSSSAGGSYHRDIRVEDGKLFYEKRWFRRGQTVLVEDGRKDKFPAMITAIGGDAISVRKTTDNAKIRIYINQLVKGRFVLKRRAA